MIVKNEEKYLARCLDSAAAMVDEIIVVDTGSTDRTIEIALEYGAKLFHFEWCDDFSAARNYALKQASGDWMLVLDADEYFVEGSADVIRAFTSTTARRIGLIDIVSRFVEYGHEFEGVRGIPRLFPRGVTYKGRIHEQPTPLMPMVETGLRLLHDGYYMTDKSIRNIPLLLKALVDEPDSAYLNFQLGRQYQGTKQHELAEQYLKKAYALLKPSVPFAAETVTELLQAHTKCKHYDQALALVGDEIALLESSPDFCFAVAQFLLDYAIDSQDYSVVENIENSYLKCLELGRRGVEEVVVGSSNFLAAYNLAVFYESVGNDSGAQQYYALSASYGYEPAIERVKG
ncbi:glycosyltransferase [Cohnella cellulosilytica]|uniref:Glycosyltransferase n=2 Tax=Cohnella cellulosilytica TaxID=986710 RepID=A0ABW2FMU4_9BACL